MDENEITQRLRDAGQQSVPGEVRASHLSQMHAVAPVVEKQKRFGRLAVAAAAFVGFAVGSTGFAMAGALPDPAQQVAHDVLAVVQVDVENPRANRGQCISAIAKSDKSADQKAIEKQACKDAITPGRAGQGGPPDGVGKGRPDHAGTPGGPNGPPHADDDCKGPPPWAGKGGETYTSDQKATYRQGCVDDDGGDPAEAQAEALEEQQEREADALEQEQGQPVPPPAFEQGDAGAQGDAPAETPPAPPADAAPEQPADDVAPEQTPAETDTNAPAG